MDVDNVGDASSPLSNQDILTMELILPARIASSVNCRPKTSARHAASFGASSEAGKVRVARSRRSKRKSTSSACRLDKQSAISLRTSSTLEST